MELFDILAGGIMVGWSLVNIIASWRLRVLCQQLIDERRELRRWVRLNRIANNHNNHERL